MGRMDVYGMCRTVGQHPLPVHILSFGLLSCLPIVLGVSAGGQAGQGSIRR